MAERFIIFGGIRLSDIQEEGGQVRSDHLETQCSECKDTIYLWQMHRDYDPKPQDQIFHMCANCFTEMMNDEDTRDKHDDIYLLGGEGIGLMTINQFKAYMMIRELMK